MRPFHALGIGFVVGSAIFAIATIKYSPPVSAVRPSSEVLVGIGCEGPSFIAVAIEEDMLPRCASIEVHQVTQEYQH